MDDKLTRKSQEALSVAIRKAAANGNPQVDPLHLLAALLEQSDGTTAPLLRNPLGFGQMSITAWQGFANWMLANKLISKHVDASTVATDAYLPAK